MASAFCKTKTTASSLTAVAASKAAMVAPKDEQKPFLEQLLREGVNEDGSKELLAVVDGYCESTQSWRELLG
jgi:hypothetical protein